MAPWEFVLAVFSGFVGLLIGFNIIDRIAENRRRDRRVAEWTRMVLEKQRAKEDWYTKTYRDD